jgi:Protein of unknown function DUF111
VGFYRRHRRRLVSDRRFGREPMEREPAPARIRPGHDRSRFPAGSSAGDGDSAQGFLSTGRWDCRRTRDPDGSRHPAPSVRFRADRTASPRLLVRSGIGFGTKALPGISNCVRALVFDAVKGASPSDCREIAVVDFEVDDHSAEDLAIGLERLREHDGIVDIVQMPVFGKKGRLMTSVRALTRVEALEQAVAACFRETTTIGLRHRIVSRSELPRRVTTVEVQGRPVNPAMLNSARRYTVIACT